MTLVDLINSGDVDSAAFFEAIASAGDRETLEVVQLAKNDDPKVRSAVALALPLLAQGGEPTSAVIEALIDLTGDSEPQVRSHACCSLGQQLRSVDSPAVRDALFARLNDDDDDARCEALLGLAYRRDRRVTSAVRAALSRPDGQVWRLELLAAGALSDPELYELVMTHQEGWSTEQDRRTAHLVLRLTDPSGPGADIIEGAAELYRRRSRGEPDGLAIDGWTTLAQMLDLAPWRGREFLDAVLAHVSGDYDAQVELRERSSLSQWVRNSETSGPQESGDRTE